MSDSKKEWQLSESYGVGVQYTYRNLLKDNPYRKNFIRQWLARFDHENVKKYYNYETGASKKKGDLEPTEIHYDQVQRMIHGANLPSDVEFDLFYHLDYLMNKEKHSIDFLRLKEFFAFCGIDGVYDLENRKHFLMNLDQDHMPMTINFHNWDAENIASNQKLLARMMSTIEEVPDYRKEIEETLFEYNVLWQEMFTDTELCNKLMDRMNSVFGDTGGNFEAVERAIQKAKEDGVDIDEYDDEIREFTEKFNKIPEAKKLDDRINFMREDEARRLEIAIEKHASLDVIMSPDVFKEYDKDLSSHGRAWDMDLNEDMKDYKKWGKKFIGHDSYETCSSGEPTEEELPLMNKRLVAKGEFGRARFAILMQDFLDNQAPEIRSRYCAIKDWILRDYTMNDINKGELAKARKIDIPILFEQALRDELEDGLLTGLDFPIRVEKLDDNSGNCKLVLNGYDVEIFDPATISPDLKIEINENENDAFRNLDERFIDFEIYDNDLSPLGLSSAGVAHEIASNHGKNSEFNKPGSENESMSFDQGLNADDAFSASADSGSHDKEPSGNLLDDAADTGSRAAGESIKGSFKNPVNSNSFSGGKAGINSSNSASGERTQPKNNTKIKNKQRSFSESDKSEYTEGARRGGAPRSSSYRETPNLGKILDGSLSKIMSDRKAEKAKSRIENRISKYNDLVSKMNREGRPMSAADAGELQRAILSNHDYIKGLDRKRLSDRYNVDKLKEIVKDCNDLMKGILRNSPIVEEVKKATKVMIEVVVDTVNMIMNLIKMILGASSKRKAPGLSMN